MPGRLLIEDAAAYRESALRVLDFLKTRPLTLDPGRAHRVGHAQDTPTDLDLTTIPMSTGSSWREKI